MHFPLCASSPPLKPLTRIPCGLSQPGHVTPRHSHPRGFETFFLLSGHGIAHCAGESFPVSAGDVVVFPPCTEHGIDFPPDSERAYCIQVFPECFP